MSLKRKAYEDMRFWKAHKSKQALLVTGSRQVGKTFLVREFLADNYKSHVEFNLMDDDAARESFAAARNADDLMLRISVAAPGRLVARETAIFIDEIQECPSIMRHIKKLVDADEHDFILSGSLLGVGLEGVDTYPGGYVSEIKMFPLDLEEFCWANGVGDEAWGIARESFAACEAVPDFVHERLLDLFHRYLLVGGLPAVVSAFVRDGVIDQVRIAQAEILKLYRRDISKYAPREDRLVIQNIFDLIPSEITGTSKRFKFSSIENVKRYSQVTDQFLWLTRAGVAFAVYNASGLEAPLLMSKRDGQFKLFLADVGLLTATYSKRDTLGLLDGRPGRNLGGVYENAVAQEMAAHGYSLYYHAGRSIGEIDFAIERNPGAVTLIEVKSGGGYRTHASLDKAVGKLRAEEYEAFVLAECNTFCEDGVTYLPIYFCSLL